jgi:hypothetical protein
MIFWRGEITKSIDELFKLVVQNVARLRYYNSGFMEKSKKLTSLENQEKTFQDPNHQKFLNIFILCQCYSRAAS